MKFAIIGYGAAGTFAALRLRESLLERGRKVTDDDIFLIEKNGQGLRKVKISGGGRCNVTHFEFDPKTFVSNYPRGHKELLGPMHQFQAGDTIEWFAKRGVELKNEEDGRMFPTTDSSQTIIDCFERELKTAKIQVLSKCNVSEISSRNSTEKSTFSIHLKRDDKRGSGNTDEDTLEVMCLLIATGSDPSGHRLAKNLGHTITDLAPSLFTFKIKDPLLRDLSGTSFKKADIRVEMGNKKWLESGPLLITHWGLSGPAILKISAWAARELKKCQYKFPLWVNFTGLPPEKFRDLLERLWSESPKKNVLNTIPSMLTKNFWNNFFELRETKEIKNKKNNELSHKEKDLIVKLLTQYPFNSGGSHRFKEEFVECGGINNKEVNFKTMESKIVPGLFFAGEILDIDGVTGGFNFQNAWTGGFIAGSSMAGKVDVDVDDDSSD